MIRALQIGGCVVAGIIAISLCLKLLIQAAVLVAIVVAIGLATIAYRAVRGEPPVR